MKKRGKYNYTKPPIKLHDMTIFKDVIEENPYSKILLVIIGKFFGDKLNNNNHYNFIKKLLRYDNLDFYNLIRKITYYTSTDYSRIYEREVEYIFYYGIVNGKIKYNEYTNKISQKGKEAYSSGERIASYEHFYPKYYIERGFSEQEAIDIVEGRKKKAQQKSKQVLQENPNLSTTKIGYYLDKGMSEDEAKEALRNRQTTFSLEICIEKYGDGEGKKVWQERQDKWQDTMTSKSPEEILRINKLKVEGSLSSTTCGRSKKEEDFISKLEYFYGIEIERNVILEENNLIRTFDGRYKNILIEFQGTYWHCDPREYKSDFFHTIKKKYAQEIWDYDLEKKTLFESIGYEIVCVWEKDYDNKEELAKTLQEFGKYV